jgi:hypothetical protein
VIAAGNQATRKQDAEEKKLHQVMHRVGGSATHTQRSGTSARIAIPAG